MRFLAGIVAAGLISTAAGFGNDAPAERPIDLAQIDLAQIDLAQIDLAQIDLAQIDLAQIDLAKIDAQVKPVDRLHWSFQPVEKPAIPAVKDKGWVRNPIDAFVLAGLEEQGWRPAAAVEPRALVRRLYFDLIGLPPSPDAIEEFVRAWDAASAKRQARVLLDRVVGQLLASPQHGERWGRHWLDVVRYAESNGYERDAAKPNIWRYRDYVIRAVNDDKPFDRFIIEQLAGDELDSLPSTHRGRGAGGEGMTADTLIALGFNRLGPWDDEPADPKEDRFDQLDDLVNATSSAFLGLTLACCRCHDHKFEPLTMHDYYRMAAIFNPLDRPRKGRTELDLPVGTRQQLDQEAERNRKIAELIKGLPADKTLPAEVAEQVARLKQHTPSLPRGYFLHEPGPTPPDTHLLVRGKATRPGPKVAPGLPTVLVDRQPAFPAPGVHTSRRRLTLARWIASPQNPLTARVIVNRVWAWHFGEGLVRTPNDFGVMGAAPTHPELLDWLAATFVDNGWSLKQLHRLIVTSNTYQMSKRWNAEYAAADPENQRLWRFPVKRLEVEAIRDAMLAVSGRLNPAMYGPSIYPEVPKEALAGNSDPDKIWKAFDEVEASRRTVYAFIKRSFVVPLLETLDLCDTTRPADKRLVTTVAPQALMLFNGDFVNRQARHFADRLRREAGEDRGKQIERAYLLALGRAPSAMERRVMGEFLERETLEQMCRVVLNLNEFVYVD
ncbi:MAG: DUF1549 and DUF1553 domain-containing protein [Gemmataceae bacterium]|nr:DUF1549 and DUF1553 domain-containing protein [Gemmataceae bacterium]